MSRRQQRPGGRLEEQKQGDLAAAICNTEASFLGAQSHSWRGQRVRPGHLGLSPTHRPQDSVGGGVLASRQ